MSNKNNSLSLWSPFTFINMNDYECLTETLLLANNYYKLTWLSTSLFSSHFFFFLMPTHFHLEFLVIFMLSHCSSVEKYLPQFWQNFAVKFRLDFIADFPLELTSYDRCQHNCSLKNFSLLIKMFSTLNVKYFHYAHITNHLSGIFATTILSTISQIAHQTPTGVISSSLKQCQWKITSSHFNVDHISVALSQVLSIQAFEFACCVKSSWHF